MKTFKDLKANDILRTFKNGMLEYVTINSAFNAGGMLVLDCSGKKFMIKKPEESNTRYNGTELFACAEAAKSFVINKIKTLNK